MGKLIESGNDADQYADALLHATVALAPIHVAYVTLMRGRSEEFRTWVVPQGLKAPRAYQSPGAAHLMSVHPFTDLIAAGHDGVFHLWEVAPLGYTESESFRHHYGQFGYSDEIGFAITLERGFWMLLGVRSDERFSYSDMLRMKAIRPLVIAALGRLATLVARAFDDEHRELELESALEQFGTDVLTSREHDVVQLILRGHNTESVSHQLDISWNTVRRHRTRAYSKLRVSSQGELFHAFLASLGLKDGG